jgi:hypothetical protein
MTIAVRQDVKLAFNIASTDEDGTRKMEGDNGTIARSEFIKITGPSSLSPDWALLCTSVKG